MTKLLKRKSVTSSYFWHIYDMSFILIDTINAIQISFILFHLLLIELCWHGTIVWALGEFIFLSRVL